MISLFTSTSMLIGHSRHLHDKAFPIAEQPMEQRERPAGKLGERGLAQDSRAAQAEQLRRLLSR